MSKIITLTKNLKDAKNLRSALCKFDDSFATIPCMTKEDIIKDSSKCADCEYIFSTWYMPEFSESEVKFLFPELRAVFYAAGTVKYFAEPFLKNNIRVFSAASANGIPVAEFTASQIILANKGYFQAQESYRWPAWHHRFHQARSFSERKHGNYGAKIGIIGCGAIGSKVVELLKPYKLSIYVYDPYLTDHRSDALGVEKVSLEQLFSCSDVISNHLPDIPETRGMINYSLLSSMKPTATFINTGRGAQVDEKALNKVLKRNKDMCALLDVTSHEPLFPWSPLYWRKNVFLSPHIAGSLSEEYGRMVEYMVNAYHDTCDGIANACETDLNIIAKQSLH